MADSPSPQLRVRDVADHYGLTERFVRHLVAERRIPFYKIGNSIRFDRGELDKWLADQKVETV